MPPNWVGPVVEDTATVRARTWHLDGPIPFASAILFTRFSFGSLEQEADIMVRQEDGTVLRSESVMLANGQLAWVIESVSSEMPLDLKYVKVVLQASNRTHTLSLFGDTLTGTYDFDYLMTIGTTLCAE